MRRAEMQTAEVQTEHVQTEHVRAAEVQTEHVQTEHVQTERVQTERVQTERVQTAEVQTEHVQTALVDQLSCLATKMESVRRLRASSPSSTVADTLLEAVDVVTGNCISAPAVMATLDVGWAAFEHAQEMLKTCRQREELGALVISRDRLREELSINAETFLQETNELLITARTHTLEELLESVRGVCPPGAVAKGVQQGAFEELRLWRSGWLQKTSAVRQHTDHALSHLRGYLANSLKQLCATEEASVCVSDVSKGVEKLLELAETAIDQELENSQSSQEQHTADAQIVLHSHRSLMQLGEAELSLLRTLRDTHTLCSKFKQEAVQWKAGPPSLTELLSVKKKIRSLHTQLRWKQMEASFLEEAEEQDLMEILKKKEEVAETRKALFQHISIEQREYEKLVALAEKCFPELPLLHLDADILSYMRSGGVLLKSLDRDMMDTEPMRELSGRRPLLCSEYLGQRVILKGYCVEADAEEKVLERATLFRQTQRNCPHLLPLLGLFYGKNDPLAYVMVSYLPNSSLRLVQKRSPLTSPEVVMVMRGVAVGLQALHSAQITHGALHPGNVFVSNREQGIVGDYDLTKTPEQRGVDGVMKAGNISLLPPEYHQAGNTHTTAASDMYAYGCLLLWLHHPDFDGAMESDSQMLDTSALNLEPHLRTLLSKLLIGCGRLAAAEVLKELYFAV
ncbi:serine/threonine-protein kinase 31 [Clupea harengus]|uniref:Serine/threonine-protein kinase 31 n=1 Tax=Clupea harengus TaxID=7950 RepID=A0A6P8G7X4_CLUHA|nr:serine/threonine-protein kinase 31 [Clupea harengus]